jgi:hypothetical protein
MLAGSAIGAALLICSSSAMAHGNVDWSISIGAPAYYPPPVVYSPPPAVYVQPQRIYQPAPVVEYRAVPYYGYERYGYRERYWREHEWREHHHRDHDRDH